MCTAPSNNTVKPPAPPSDSNVLPGEMVVKFINGPGPDKSVAAKPGSILLSVGDANGITIPRGCVSGLCGACTVDIVDEASPDGLQTVRACQTSVTDIDGSGTMVVDLNRVRQTRARGPDPMARFNNLDTEYVAFAAPKKKGRMREGTCDTCKGSGEEECYACDGIGYEDSMMCTLCSGTGILRCADCQGEGIIMLRNR